MRCVTAVLATVAFYLSGGCACPRVNITNSTGAVIECELALSLPSYQFTGAGPCQYWFFMPPAREWNSRVATGDEAELPLACANGPTILRLRKARTEADWVVFMTMQDPPLDLVIQQRADDLEVCYASGSLLERTDFAWFEPGS